MQFLVLVVVALVPLLITPNLLSHYDITPKIVLLSCCTALILLYRNASASNARALFRAPAGRWFGMLVGAEWLAASVATGFSTNRALSLHGGTWRRLGWLSETGLLLFVLVAAGWAARDQDNLRRLLRASTYAGALASVYGIAQYLGIDPWLGSSGYEVGDGPFRIVRPPGTLGHADYFADWLVAVSFLALGLAAVEKRPWPKRIAVSASLVAVLAIVLTGTRGALLGVLAGVLVVGFARGRRIRPREVALAGAFVVAVVILFFVPLGAKLRARVHWSMEDARGGARLLLWRDSIQMAAHRPLAGYGPETFATDFPRFESLELARAYPDFYHESPHNIFLDALAGEGLIGLAALLGLCGLGVWAAYRAWRLGHPLAAPLSAGLAGMLVAQQFAVFVFTTSLYFHLLIALLVVTALPQQPSETSKSAQSWWVLAASLPVSLVLALYATHLVAGDHALAVAEQRIAANDATGAASAYRTVLTWQMPGASDDLPYSVAMQQLAGRSPIFAIKLEASQQALESAIRAVSTAEDRQNAWYNLATVLATRNDALGVERALRNAIAWAPNWFKPHWTLAQLLELTNRKEEALVEARAAVERDGNKDPEVAETWKKLGGQP